MTSVEPGAAKGTYFALRDAGQRELGGTRNFAPAHVASGLIADDTP